eukprot:6186182-Pleurochrysis_carterae.AAC.1
MARARKAGVKLVADEGGAASSGCMADTAARLVLGQETRRARAARAAVARRERRMCAIEQ